MRLRQMALAARGLDAVTAQLQAVFGLSVAYNDPGIHHYGLRNAVLSAGNGFIEVVEPIREDASAARFLNRRGGDAGYMVILQVADAQAERERAVALGARVVDDIDGADYRCAHFHPADFGGVLTSFDQQRTEADYLKPDGDWWPAGKAWRDAPAETGIDLLGVTLTSSDPAALARRWSDLLSQPLDAAEPLRLSLARGHVRFVAAVGANAGARLGGVDLKVADVARARRRAREAGLDVTEAGILIGGVRFRPAD